MSSNPPVAANSSTLSPSTTTSSTTNASAPAPAKKPTSPYAVSAIPPFRAPGASATAALSYSQATGGPAANGGSKGQPVQPVVTNSHARNQSVSVKPDGSGGMSVAPSRVNQIRNAVDTKVAFGTSQDANSILSSSPAAPPLLAQNAPVKAFGTVPASNAVPSLSSLSSSTSSSPAPTTPSVGATTPAAGQPHPKMNLHSFFGAGAPSPSSSPAPSSQTPRPMQSSPAPFAPTAFVPGQPFMPQPQQPSSSQGGGNKPLGLPSTPTFSPQQQRGGPGQLNGPPRLGQGQQQPSFSGVSGPGSPRVQQMYAPQAPPQNWQGSYGGYMQPGYYGYPPPLPQQSHQSPQPGSGIPPPHVPHPSPGPGTPLRASGTPFSPSVAEFKPSGFGGAPSPSPVSISHPMHPGSPAPLSTDAPTFQPRQSKAIKIRNPKDLEREKAEKERLEREKAQGGDDEAAKAKAVSDKEEVDKKKAADDAAAAAAKAKEAEEKKAKEEEKAKRVADEEAAAAKKKADEEAEEKRLAKEKADAEAKAKEEAEQKAKVEAEKKAEEERVAAEKEAAEKKAADEQKAADERKAAEEKKAAEAKATEEKEQKEKDTAAAAATVSAKEASDAAAAALAAATGPAAGTEEVEGLKVKSSQADTVRKEEKTLATEEKAVAGDSPAPASTPSSLPAKPVTANGSAPSASEKRVPSALDLSSAKSSSAAAPPSALSTARAISDLSTISYPSNIKSPRPDLNVAAEPGKYRYDREFLMQFMSVCIEKPDNLPNLEAIGMVDAGNDAGGRGPGGAFPGPGARRTSSMGPPIIPGRTQSGGGFGRGQASGMGGFGSGMGNFGTGPAVPSTSEARFAASSAAGGPAGRAVSGAFGGGVPRPMARTPSQGGPGGAFGPPQGRTTSRGGKPRQDGPGGRRGGVPEGMRPGQHVAGEGFEDAKLVATENRWMPSKLGGETATDENSPEMVQRKVKALLNKLTLERFESISNQILEWANKSVNEEDGRILRQVIALIFEKATDEANWSEMYARLCRKLMEMVSPDVKDLSVKGADGNPVAGGALFRKYLLNRCQEDYEAGWKQKEVSAAAAASKAADDNAKKEANDAAEAAAKEAEASGKESSAASKEAELLSDEYYAAQKAKRRGLGLVRFIGELYRLHMLTERIMHECIKKLLANTESPEEEDVESLCRLLTTVGKGLDNAKAKGHMDVYFQRMKLISNNQKISSRIRFMIQDVAELRADRWEPRNVAAGPKLISEIHADAQKAAEDSARRTVSSTGKGLPRLQDQLSRPNSGRGGTRREQFGVPPTGADGFTAVPQRPAKAGDLSGFGKIRDSSAGGSISLGPTGAFANRAAKAKQDANNSRPATPSNPYALLAAAESEASARPKLVLAPRTKPLGEDGDAAGEGEEGKADEEQAGEDEEEEDDDDGAIDPNAISMSKAEAERRAGNSVKEFFSVKNIAEGVASVEALPVEYRGLLVAQLGDAALQKKPDDVNLTRQLYAELLAKSVLSHDSLLAALDSLIKTLIDVAIDVPSAYTYASHLLLGAGASRSEVETLSQKMESEEEEEEEVERARGLLLAAFDKLQQ